MSQLTTLLGDDASGKSEAMEDLNVTSQLQQCPNCKTWKKSSVFVNKSGTCPPCGSRYMNKYKNTLDGRLYQIYTWAHSGALNRKNKGRDEASSVDIDVQFLHEQYARQDGKCFYSGIKMSLETGGAWLISIERLNPSLGYTRDNTRFIVNELNGQAQWTLDKIAKLPQLIHSDVSISDLQQAIKLARVDARTLNGGNNVRIRRETEDRFGTLWLKCTLCAVFQACTSFQTSKCKIGYRARCKACAFKVDKSGRLDTMRSHCSRLETHCRVSDEESKLFHAGHVSITLENLFDKIMAQQGRCYYSGVPLCFGTASSWRCSPERIDNNKLHTNDNVVLVALEFNTSKQWSREKFACFLQHIQAKLSNTTAALTQH